MPAQRVVPDVEMSRAGGDREARISQGGTSRDPQPVVQPITAEDLVAVITGVLQVQQQAAPPPPPPQPVVVKTPTSIITEFVSFHHQHLPVREIPF